MTKALTPGKQRGLQQCATAYGALVVLALDHRNNLRAAMEKHRQPASDADLVHFKREVTRVLAPSASAMLLDPEYGAFPAVSGGDLPGSVGLIVALEATGYLGESDARESRILENWSVRQAKRMGASAVKLLVYYHPDSPTAPEIEALLAQTAEDCRREDIPLFLEPLSYSLKADEKQLGGDERRRIVIETARRLTPLGADVLKAEFPLDIAAYPSESDWQSACRELSDASAVPWVLLSASVSFETYLRQVRAACENGASGVAVGRAVWKEAAELPGSDRRSFLYGAAANRMGRIAGLCNALARPWTECFSIPQAGAGFYAAY